MNFALYDERNKPVETFKYFNDAMKALAEKEGEWGANWSRGEIIKGKYAVREYSE